MDLLVKGTAHTRMKVIGAKITVKTSATCDIGRLTKSFKEEERRTNLRFSRFLAVSLAMRFSHLGGIVL